MKYIYHYHAIYQVNIGTVTHADGTCERSHPISNNEDYMAFKTGVAKECGVETEQLSICSLTLISSANSLLDNQ